MNFSKVTDFQDSPLGKFPKEWAVREIAGLIETETGKRAKGGGLSKGMAASIGGEHVGVQGKILWGSMKFIPEEFYDFLKQGKIRKGDILLVKDGATTGKVAIADSLHYEKAAVNEHVFLVRSKTDQLLNQFIFYFLFSKFGQKQIKTKVHGLIGGIIRKDLETIVIPVPSEEEQQKIVEVLGTFDSALELADRVIAKTERLKKGLMQQLLTRGIGHTEYKQTPIGQMPTDWAPTKIGDLAKLQSGGTPRRDVKEYWANGKIPWLKSGELNDGEICKAEERISQLGLENSAAKIFPKGTLLMAMYGKGTVTKTGILSIEAATNQAVCAFIPKDRKFSSKFLQYSLIFKRSQLLGQLTNPSTDMGRTNIYSGMLASFHIPLPAKMEEQNKIAGILQEVGAKLGLEQFEKSKLQRIKRGLMDLLLTGKIRIKVD